MRAEVPDDLAHVGGDEQAVGARGLHVPEVADAGRMQRGDEVLADGVDVGGGAVGLGALHVDGGGAVDFEERLAERVEGCGGGGDALDLGPSWVKG